MRNFIRTVKNSFVPDKLEFHTIKFGVSQGRKMLINRRHQFRFEFGLYETGIANHFRRLTKNVTVAYDIGSAYGYYVLAMDRQGIDKIFSFEQDAQLVNCLQKSIDENKIRDKVTILQYFVGDRSDSPMCRIDDLIAEKHILPPGFIKMDIEGAEVLALHGAEQCIQQYHPACIIEVHGLELEKKCHDFLLGKGYRNVHIVEDRTLTERVFPEVRPAGHNRWLVAWY